MVRPYCCSSILSPLSDRVICHGKFRKAFCSYCLHLFRQQRPAQRGARINSVCCRSAYNDHHLDKEHVIVIFSSAELSRAGVLGLTSVLSLVVFLLGCCCVMSGQVRSGQVKSVPSGRVWSGRVKSRRSCHVTSMKARVLVTRAFFFLGHVVSTTSLPRTPISRLLAI